MSESRKKSYCKDGRQRTSRNISCPADNTYSHSDYSKRSPPCGLSIQVYKSRNLGIACCRLKFASLCQEKALIRLLYLPAFTCEDLNHLA